MFEVGKCKSENVKLSRDRKRKVKLSLAAVWLAALIWAVYLPYSRSTDNVGYAPEQPIAFSHRTHAGTFGIKCLYCHTSAETGDFAAVPAVKNCMVCHIGLQTKRELTAPLIAAYDENRSIKWARVNQLPDFTRFSHSAHVTAGIDCSSCHGQAETFDLMQQTATLKMSWCLDCHRNPERLVVPARDISGICTQSAMPAVATDSAEAAFLKLIPKPRKMKQGAENCSVCHF